MSVLRLSQIRRLCVDLAPELGVPLGYDGPESSSTWAGELSNGKAVEILALCALFRAVVLLGYEVEVPRYLIDSPALLYEQNTLPKMHASMPGVSASVEKRSIMEQYTGALLPRLVVRSGTNVWGIFREGFPLHALLRHISGASPSISRPDLIIVPGANSVEMISDSIINYVWAFGRAEISIELRTVIRDEPEVIAHSSLDELDFYPRASGIVECSVRKSDRKLMQQLTRYIDEYGLGGLERCAFVTLEGGTSLDLGVSANLSLINGLSTTGFGGTNPLADWLSGVLAESTK
jgi:hypothetical protein